MSWVRLAIGCLGLTLCAATLLGIFVRRRFRTAVFFTLYLAFVLVADGAAILRPQTFYTKDAWMVREFLVAALRLALALELAYWTFRGFPSAALSARCALLLSLVATWAAVVSEPATDPGFPTVLGHIVPRAANGLVWMLTSIAALVLWYRLPLTYVQKTILVTLGPYLLVLAMARSLLISSGGALSVPLGYLQPLAFMVIEACWCYAAWRKAEDPAVLGPPETDRMPRTVRPA